MTLRLRKPFLEFPLLRRELIGLLRMRKAFWLLLLVVAFSGLLPLLAWPERGPALGSPFFGRILFQTFIFVQLALALLVIPAFTAGAISGERERETYDLLYSTLLSPFSIIFSKMAASTGYVLILLLASAPSVCVIYLLGGISFGSILKCYAMVFAASIAAGLICLKQSMRSRRTAHAAVRGILGVVFWNGGLLLLIMAIQIWFEATSNRASSSVFENGWLLMLSPFAAIFVELFGGEFGPMFQSMITADLVFLLNLAYAGAVSAWQLFYLLRKVRTPELSVSRRRERRQLKKQARAAGRPRRALLANALIGLGEGGFPLLRNPVFLKEVRSEFFSRPWYRRISFFGSLVFFLSFIILGRGEWEMLYATCAAAMVLMSIVAPAIAAGSIPREIEHGNLDFLRGTLLPLGTVLRGKFLASLYASGGVLSAALLTILIYLLTPHGRLMSFDSPSLERWRVLVSASVVTTTFLFVNSLATFASAVSKRTLGALVIAYLGVLAVFIGWPILLELSGGPGGDSRSELFSITNPFAALSLSVEGYPPAARSPHWTFSCFLLFHLLACAALWVLADRRLETLRARDR